jgi:hypothetical protein
MSAITWDDVGDRIYESGIDRGVLYLEDNSGVPWNGLTAVIEKFDRTRNPVYFDGMKISDLVVSGTFEASLKAYTYPDEFNELEGLVSIGAGMYLADQPPRTFHLSYRTRVGNDVTQDLGYKIHVVYNLTAIPQDKPYETLTDTAGMIEFEWDITAVPEDVPGFRPSAHIVIDSREFEPEILAEIEEMLYGSETEDSSLISMEDLIAFIQDFYWISITDNGDGTWTAYSPDDDLITVVGDEFTITSANADYLDADTYQITDGLEP